MVISRKFDENGVTIEKVELSDADNEAIEEAHKIVEERCAAAEVDYGAEQKEWMEWCFLGALRIGGIPELMRYVREAKICKRKRNIRTGYAGTNDTEDLI